MRRSYRSPDNQAMSNQLDPRPRHARPAFGGRGLFLGFHPADSPARSVRRATGPCDPPQGGFVRPIGTAEVISFRVTGPDGRWMPWFILRSPPGGKGPKNRPMIAWLREGGGYDQLRFESVGTESRERRPFRQWAGGVRSSMSR
jgi:hypothetical protein